MISETGDRETSVLRLLLGIFLCSAAAISLEITLTRVFSISLWYHFAFMVISIAMLGLGLSGTVLSLAPSLKKKRLLGDYALLLAIFTIVGYLGTNMIPLDPARFAWERSQVLYVGAYYVLLSVPFFFFGLIVTTAFSVKSERASLVYAADLIGAGTGSVAAVFFMAGLGPEHGIYAVTVCALLGAFAFGRSRASLILLACVMVMAVASPNFMTIRMSEYKGLQQALRFPGAKHLNTYYSGFARVDTFESPMVRFAPGMSLKYLEPLPHQIGLSVDGTGISAITNSKGDLEFLSYLPAALPYEIKDRDSVLVIEPKGGLPILLARKYDAGHIESTESNPLIVDVINQDHAEFSGGIYAKKNYGKLGRSRLISTDSKFDVIDISLTGAVPSGMFGISEGYDFTIEAFTQYISRLTDDGVLSLNVFIIPPPRTDLRLLTTAIAALEKLAIAYPEENIAAIRSWGSITLLIKRTAFTHDEIEMIKRFSKRKNFDLVYYPGITEAESNVFVRMPDNEYFKAFQTLIDPDSRDGFVRGYVFDITPVTDRKPFFDYYLKLGKLRETMAVMGNKWQFFIDEGYILPIVLVQVVLLSVMLLFIPLLKRKNRARPTSLLIYFALLGFGFMFVEVPLIQGMILPLENPSYAIAVVLASILICSGVGSLLSHKYEVLRAPRTVMLLAVMIVPYGLLLTLFTGKITAYPLAAKFALSFLLVLPVALFMGIPFPMGIRLLGHKQPTLIPWAWAVNGCFSVMAPILASILALVFGFKAVFLLGALMYTGAYVVLKRAWSID